MDSSCARPDKEGIFHSWRDARRAVRRVTAQSGYRLRPYVCGDHLHLTKDDSTPGVTEDKPTRLLAHRYLNRPRFRRAA